MTTQNKLQRVLEAIGEHKTTLRSFVKQPDIKKTIYSFKQETKLALDNLKSELQLHEQKVTERLNIKLNALRSASAQMRIANNQQIKVMLKDIDSLKESIKELSDRKTELPDFTERINEMEFYLGTEILHLKEDIDSQFADEAKTLTTKLKKLETDLIELRKRIGSSLSTHGGNANRNILVSGNSSTLSRYTDLNIKPGANITLTYTNNDNLKTTDLTITGMASSSAITRSISTVSVSSVIAALASTDYVIIANQGVQLTMPTAVSNTNLYTIKNTSTSSIMIVASGAETIDGSANIILPVQYTSVDLISDNANFNIT